MASLRDLRSRISSVKNTQQVTRAMKMVAAAKLRRAQESIFQTRPYAYKISEIIARLKGQLDPSFHPLFVEREEVQNVLLVIVTADRGLAGGFNANVIKQAEQEIEERFSAHRAEKRLFLLCVGRKGHEHFSRRGYQLVGDWRGTFDKLSFSTADRVASAAEQGFLEGRWDEVYVIYNEFKNTISQNRIVEPFLPVRAERFLTPVMELEVSGEPASESPFENDLIYEPGVEAILNTLMPRYLNYEIWRILLDSNAAEQGARMVAMDNATNNASDLLKDLKLKYNRARQDAITKELIEITSGADALEAG
ncbi:MAG: ATP synthase F1 subunit gamma [Bacteroidetes bacterium]|nr:ATP synthase F1 subunit gamma [Bacteroidota bacterium]MDA0874424.1 ATP synthase F1 subunit gamma [Bacteroidota bacterium]